MRIFLLLLLLFPIVGRGQARTDGFLRDLFLKQKDSLITAVLNKPDTFRYQVIYMRIDRDNRNKPLFQSYYLNVDPKRYFNPASVVKMPLAFLSLEKLNTLRSTGIDKYTTMLFDSSWHRQRKLYADSTAESGKPSIAQFIRKAFLVSDNDAYNRMYEFLGQETINRRLHEMGFPETRITRRFMRMTEEENRHTNNIRFVDNNGKLIYEQPPAYNRDSFDFSLVHKMGNAHYANDSLIYTPIDFTKANNYPLEDMLLNLRGVMFPDDVPVNQAFRLSKDDYDFLYRYMSQYPSETSYPNYDRSKFYDSYVKFFFRHGSKEMPSHVRVFNKVGWAYGCLTDVSYVIDFKNKVEFMLAATIYVNSDGIMNDDRYDYDSIGWPFFYKIGQAIYNYELGRKRKFAPDLSPYTLLYLKKLQVDRPVIREVDN